MPCDYKNYDPSWHTKIRPDILERDGHSCKFCKVKNYALIFRGYLNGQEVFQNADGEIYEYPNGKYIETDYCAPIEPLSGDPNQKAIKVVLTIMHLDHNTENNDYSNLAAGCQRCHLVYDKEHHMKNSRETRNKKMGLISLFD